MFLIKASRAGGLNPERRRHNLLNFDFDLAVEMIATAVFGNLVGVQNNSLDVIFGNRDVQLVLYFVFVVVENLAPIGVGARQCPSGASGAIGPTYDTVRNVVPRVFAAKSSAVDIHFDIKVAASASREPIARGVRIGIARRALQEEELRGRRLRGRFRYRDLVSCREHLALGGGRNSGDGDLALGHTGHLTVRVNGSDRWIARRPRDIGVGIGFKYDILELFDGIGASDFKLAYRGLRKNVDCKRFGLPVIPPFVIAMHKRNVTLGFARYGYAVAVFIERDETFILAINPPIAVGAPPAARTRICLAFADVNPFFERLVVGLLGGNRNNDFGLVAEIVNPAAVGPDFHRVVARLFEIIGIMPVLGRIKLHAIAIVFEWVERPARSLAHKIDDFAGFVVFNLGEPEAIVTNRFCCGLNDGKRTLFNGHVKLEAIVTLVVPHTLPIDVTQRNRGSFRRTVKSPIAGCCQFKGFLIGGNLPTGEQPIAAIPVVDFHITVVGKSNRITLGNNIRPRNGAITDSLCGIAFLGYGFVNRYGIFNRRSNCVFFGFKSDGHAGLEGRGLNGVNTGIVGSKGRLLSANVYEHAIQLVAVIGHHGEFEIVARGHGDFGCGQADNGIGAVGFFNRCVVQLKCDIVLRFHLSGGIGRSSFVGGRLGGLRRGLLACRCSARRSGRIRIGSLIGAGSFNRLLARGRLRRPCSGHIGRARRAFLRLGHFALRGRIVVREHFSRVYCGPTKAQQNHRQHHREGLVPKRVAISQACRFGFLSLLRFLVHFNPPHRPFAFGRLSCCFRQQMPLAQNRI